MIKNIKLILGLAISLIAFQANGAGSLIRFGKQIGARALDLTAFNPKKTALVYGVTTGSLYYGLQKSKNKTDLSRLRTQSLGYGLINAGAFAMPVVSIPVGLASLAVGLDLMICSLDKK